MIILLVVLYILGSLPTGFGLLALVENEGLRVRHGKRPGFFHYAIVMGGWPLFVIAVVLRMMWNAR